MPTIIVNVIEGKTAEQKEALIREITKAVTSTLELPEKTVTVIINDVPKTNWGIGGMPFQKR